MAYILNSFSKSKPGHTVGLFDVRVKNPGIPLNVEGKTVSLSDSEQHTMVIGSSGRGKTRRVLYPSVILAARAGRSMIINDPKGEIYRATANEVRRCGHRVKVLNLRNPACGDRWSPLSLVQRYWDSGDHSRAIELLSDIAELVTLCVTTDRDPYWRQASMDCFVGFGLLILERDWHLTFDNIHALANEYFLHRKEERAVIRDRLDKEADSYRRLCTIVELESDTTLGCVISEFNTSITEYVSRADVRDMLCGSDFVLPSIGQIPTAYYLVAKDESKSLHSIASLFIDQAYSELVQYADTREDNVLPIRVDFILDEFGSITGSDWVNKMTAARSRGIRFTIALQNLSQLVAGYGEDGTQAILSNCRTVQYLGGRDFRMMSILTSMGGVEYDRLGVPRPCLTINDLAGMPVGETMILDDSGRPHKGHLPDWSAWGIRERARLSDKKRQFLRGGRATFAELLAVPQEEPCETAMPDKDETDLWIDKILSDTNGTEEPF